MNNQDVAWAGRLIGGAKILFMALILGATCLGVARAQVPPNQYDYSRTTSFTYDPITGFLATQTTEPTNAPSCVLTSFGYDAYGNKNSTTTANCPGATGSALFTSRTSGSNYAAPTSQVISVSDNNNVASNITVGYPSGLALTTVTNALNQSETHQVDPRFGVTTQLTGPNGLTSSWLLDDFGRKVKETLPDGTSTVVYYCVLSGLGLDTSSNTPGCPTPTTGEAPADAIAFVHTEPRSTGNLKMGAFSRVYTDRLGRTLRTVSESFDGASQPGPRSGVLIVQDSVYNVYGARVIETRPYFLTSGSSTVAGSNDVGATLTNYDVLGRPTVTYTSDRNGAAGTQVLGVAGGVSYGAYGSQTVARTSYAYSGLTVSVTNDKGQTRSEEKNAIGEVVRVTDASGAQLAHQRDAFGNLVATKDALQNTITLMYDVVGRKTQMSDPDAGVLSYCFDALGQLTAQQNSTMRGSNTPSGCPSAPNSGIAANAILGWATFAYDQLGRTTQRIEPELTSTWSYDRYADNSACNKGIGKLCQVVTSNGLNRIVVYDNLGRPLNSLATTGSGPTLGAAISYDATTGRVASEIYPTGLQIGYQYTARGFFEKLTLMTAATINPLPAVPGGTPAASTSLSAGTVLWQAQSVNAWFATERQLYGNGVIANSQYEAATGRPTDEIAGTGTSTSVLNHHYTWDSLNNLVGRNDANGDGGSGAVTETFAYGDALNRLTNYTVSAPAIAGLNRTVSLQYNALGMLLYKSDVGVYSYGPQGANSLRPHALLSVSGGAAVINGYDANGNLTSASAGKYRTISYTSFNLPDSQTGIAGPSGAPQYTWVYDDRHSRVKEVRTVTGTNPSTRTTWYLHPDNMGGLGFEREENSNAGSSNRHFLSAAGRAIAVLVSTDPLPVLPAGQTAPSALSSITLVKVEYWHKDHLGSLAATTDHAGAITARYAYDPFGKRRYTNGNYDAFGNLVIDWSPAVNAGTSRGFTGHEHLDDVGLVHMNGRIFDPTLGVFLQADPHITDVSNLQNYNRYAYCLNNPLTCTDPSGFDDEGVIPTTWTVDPSGMNVFTACYYTCGGGGASSGTSYTSPTPIYTYENPVPNWSLPADTFDVFRYATQPNYDYWSQVLNSIQPVIPTYVPPLPTVATPVAAQGPRVSTGSPGSPPRPPDSSSVSRTPPISADYARRLGGVPVTPATAGWAAVNKAIGKGLEYWWDGQVTGYLVVAGGMLNGGSIATSNVFIRFGGGASIELTLAAQAAKNLGSATFVAKNGIGQLYSPMVILSGDTLTFTDFAVGTAHGLIGFGQRAGAAELIGPMRDLISFGQQQGANWITLSGKYVTEEGAALGGGAVGDAFSFMFQASRDGMKSLLQQLGGG